jgi:hypothetical protein
LFLSIPEYIVWQNVEGELVLFDSRDGSYHALNGTAATIWRRVAEGMTTVQICDTLATAYNAPRPTIEREVDAFVEAALAKTLLRTGAGPATKRSSKGKNI